MLHNFIKCLYVPGRSVESAEHKYYIHVIVQCEIFDTCISECICRYFNEFFVYEDVFFMMRLDEVLEIVLDELKDDVLN